MEDELCQTGMESILKNVEDMALKTFVEARCASRSFRQDVENLRPYIKSSDCGKVLKLKAENSKLAEELKRERDRRDVLEQAIFVTKSDYAKVKKKLEEATIDLEVERRLRPVEKEKDLLKQTLKGRDKNLEELRKDFEHYQASHLIGASIVQKCVIG